MRRTTRGERGAALLTAMLIVTLVASLAAAMVWRQARAVQVEAAERARSQAGWILVGALDWARLILREDAFANRNAPVDHLNEVWAVPLAESRLSTFLAADRDKAAADDGPEAFLSGSIEDAQGRYNLRNLVDGSDTALEQRVFQRLCDMAGISASQAQQFALQLRTSLTAAKPASAPASDSGKRDASDTANAVLPPQRIEQLRWLGLDELALARLSPWITLLPKKTPVNLNTAPREVIAALAEGMDLGAAERLVQARKSKELSNVNDAAAYFPAQAMPQADRVSVNSNYFLVTARLRLDDRLVEERALVERQGRDVRVLDRQRLTPGSTPPRP
ncbi:type II secretion system minor pseudopilin GspK [Pelomonas sp. CA6]|uniref:type II secretion system minor pseudopilin GspK n=1 Tax=Pelomonas sp. CA6 TaxID=2907999 RepID=UPI001F4C0688|nr:type II secretion system minor pseudopilin GspK [Pelomonas sp. CA6]MCH7343267.1 type II secretion system minor pseudopilin GspK [Pelomonas sp. CA6]